MKVQEATSSSELFQHEKKGNISTSACNTPYQPEEKWKGKNSKVKQNELNKMYFLKTKTKRWSLIEYLLQA